MKQKCSDTHLEIERGWPITRAEYDDLPRRLEKLGFEHRRQLLITDFILPMITTYRLRIVRIWEDDKEFVRYMRTNKNHPLKGDDLDDIRKEIESKLRWRQARGFVLRSMDFLRAPVPFYSKLRDEYEGTIASGPATVARDDAIGLGDKSGPYMEAESTRELPLSDRSAKEVDAGIIQVGTTLLGEDRKRKNSYRKMLMRTVPLGEMVLCGSKLQALRERTDELLPKFRDARTLEKLEELGARMRRAGARALRSSAA